MLAHEISFRIDRKQINKNFVVGKRNKPLNYMLFDVLLFAVISFALECCSK